MSVYSGDAKFLIDYFHLKGIDFLIPEYQREYAWGEENVTQLFADLRYGLERIKISDTESVKREEKSKFLGCVIQWSRDAKEGEDYYPSKNNYMDKIREIIDGQQRTSTFLLVFVKYYFYFDKKMQLLNSSPEEKLIGRHLKSVVMRNWLFNSFSAEIPPRSDKNYRPVIIRKELDRWANKLNLAQYSSPISKYLNEAIQSIINKSKDDTFSVDSNTQTVLDAIDNEVRVIEKLESIAGSYTIEGLLGELFNEELEDESICINNYFEENQDRKVVVYEMLNNVAILHYLLHYCAMTVISSPTEDSALDMFQSLNSSGVQLTALQMLKPVLSSDYRKQKEDFSRSTICDDINSINNWFNDGSGRDKKLKQFYLKFCMLVDGEVAPTSLSLQRTWVKRSYLSFTQDQLRLEKTDAYVALMKSTKLYVEQFIMPSKSHLYLSNNGVFDAYTLDHPKFGPRALSTQAIMNLMYLKDSNHDLHHSLLIRFYHQFLIAQTALEADECARDLSKVIGACAAIFTGYRIAFYAHPDGFYRKLYADSFSYMKTKTLSSEFVLKTMRKAFFKEVKAKFPEVEGGGTIIERLTDAFIKNCRYQKLSASIIKFVLLNYSHNKVQDDSLSVGLLKYDVKGASVLHPNSWLDPNTGSIEHICPQSAESNSSIVYWLNDFSSSTKINDIGNLTLLCLENNQSTPEETEKKLNSYKALTCAAHNGQGPKVVSNNSWSTATQHHLIPIVSRLERWNADVKQGILPDHSFNSWSPEFVTQRSENIANLSIRDFLTSLSIQPKFV
ncbi:DUF262 domain-containing protein [Vibrio cyclitrophicus]|uniref:DUF262 domain-containing protein n=1 Tax=Vibrio cyclitrophicus TaxID=47951 RepID=UPI00030B7440|nr:DUF262 domain-containing protein [Vibrio cyclitrophicus]ERM61718.1 hypothetical protein M565_ctg1P1910 [Vibrio cyclitrophicus FF75]OEE09796.1 hypothetical protein OC5_05675 [Vibrio cyclitrophicus ZF264]OEE48427.1 hypothetical protein OAG_10415 [Vibrio cyclitrophicus FF75]